MKKYRPYKTIPAEILGKSIIVKYQPTVMSIILAIDSLSIRTVYGTYYAQDLFDKCIFADGTPCGEEYEEQVELEHDKVYIVRNRCGENWIPRHFSHIQESIYMFYNDGTSFKTHKWAEGAYQIAEYDKDLCYTSNAPKTYLIDNGL